MKINFFTPSSLGQLYKVIELYTSGSFTPAAKALFGELVAIDYSEEFDKVFLHDNKQQSLSPRGDHLDLWVESGEGLLQDLLEEAIELESGISELWEKYSAYIDLNTKVRIFNTFDFITVVLPTTISNNNVWQDYLFFSCAFKDITAKFFDTHFVRCCFDDISNISFNNCTFDTVEFISKPGNFKSCHFINTLMP